MFTPARSASEGLTPYQECRRLRFGLEWSTAIHSAFRSRIADPPSFVEPDLRRLLVLSLDRVVHLTAMNRDFARRLDTQPDFVAPNVDDGYDDIIADHYALVALPGKHKHGPLAWRVRKSALAGRYGDSLWRADNHPVRLQSLTDDYQARKPDLRPCSGLIGPAS